MLDVAVDHLDAAAGGRQVGRHEPDHPAIVASFDDGRGEARRCATVSARAGLRMLHRTEREVRHCRRARAVCRDGAWRRPGQGAGSGGICAAYNRISEAGTRDSEDARASCFCMTTSALGAGSREQLAGWPDGAGRRRGGGGRRPWSVWPAVGERARPGRVRRRLLRLASLRPGGQRTWMWWTACCWRCLRGRSVAIDFDAEAFPAFHGYDTDYCLLARRAGHARAGDTRRLRAPRQGRTRRPSRFRGERRKAPRAVAGPHQASRPRRTCVADGQGSWHELGRSFAAPNDDGTQESLGQVVMPDHPGDHDPSDRMSAMPCPQEMTACEPAGRLVERAARVLGVPPGTGELVDHATRRRLLSSIGGSVVLSLLDTLGVLAMLPMMQYITAQDRDAGALGAVSRARAIRRTRCSSVPLR